MKGQLGKVRNEKLAAEQRADALQAQLNELLKTKTAQPPAQENKKQEPHLVKAWHPRFCPDCGTTNPQFKDEMKCDGCGIHLGSEEDVRQNLKVCPNCGGTSASRL